MVKRTLGFGVETIFSLLNERRRRGKTPALALVAIQAVRALLPMRKVRDAAERAENLRASDART